METDMDECGKKCKGFLPEGLADKFPQMPHIRRAALALEAYIRDGERAAAVAALVECGLAEEAIAAMLDEVDRGCLHG